MEELFKKYMMADDEDEEEVDGLVTVEDEEDCDEDEENCEEEDEDDEE